MKNTLLKIIVVLLSINLVACSTNTREQNITAGAIAGAAVGGGAGAFVGQGVGTAVAVGVGIVGGALIGGYIGSQMDSTDNTRMYRTLDNTPTNRTTSWKNEKTNVSYAVTPTSNPMAMGGYQNCRSFRTTAYINGKRQQVQGNACRQSDGTWKTINA